MISLDGVMQAPGGPDEDRSGGFEYGGWVAPYGDESAGKLMQKLMQPTDLLLGRKTFEIWEHYWPKHKDQWPGINEVSKFVFSSTRESSSWSNSYFISSVKEIEALKNQEGSTIQVWGSGELIQLLLKYDLADELWIMIHPLTLGKGKKLFTDGPIPAAFKLAETLVTTTGVIMANYCRSGEVITGDLTAE